MDAKWILRGLVNIFELIITHKSSFCHHIEIAITPHQDKPHCRLWQEDGTKEEKSGGWLWRETLQSGQSGNLQTLKRTLVVAALFHGEHIWSSTVFYSAAYIQQCFEPGRSHFTFCVCVLWICVSVHLCTLQCVEPGGSYFPASSTIIRPASSPPSLSSHYSLLCQVNQAHSYQWAQVHTHTQKIVLLESRLAIFVLHCSPSNST